MKINSVELDVSAVRRSQYPDEDLPEFLMVGRSNVGKSSFVNTLVNRKNIARTSARPGKTQTLNFYLVKCVETCYSIIPTPCVMTRNVSRLKEKNNFHVLFLMCC